ncbi:MAG: iron ABC transporter permease [Euryarchaeota archaeon]|nr:iron ABC transporter permease [Euryarchaeota archaeon]
MDTISKKHIANSKLQISKIIALVATTLLFSLLAMGWGSSSNLDMTTTMKIILGLEEPDNVQSAIIWKLRFPRILMAIIAGAALATAGALMQGCLGNPLVSPLTLGVASGAALGAAFAIILDLSVFPQIAIVANSFLFSLIVVGVIIQLGKMRSVSAESYILVGIAITFIAGAIVSTMQYFATDAQLSQLTHWSFGSLSRPTLSNVVWIGFGVSILMPLAMSWSWDLNTMSLGGDDFAISTGVDPESTRMNILILSALMTSLVIAFTGLIGFVGLAAPHMSRLVIGNDYRKLIPCSAVTGSFLMLFADTVGRIAFAPIIIPVGIMLSIIGGPLFMYLLLRNRGEIM